MTDQIAYQEYIQRRYNAFCKTVIRCAALDKILKLKRQWERQVSLDYLMNEKFVQFAASEPDEEYPSNYSHFYVGAALLLADGRIVIGSRGWSRTSFKTGCGAAFWHRRSSASTRAAS